MSNLLLFDFFVGPCSIWYEVFAFTENLVSVDLSHHLPCFPTKINIALSEIDVIAKPSRCTFALANWIEERNRNVYPKMEG